jgi:hypothetical protein
MVAPTKTRSPNYPAMSLQEAIAKVAAIYKKEYNHLVAREVVAKHIGYGGINGASATALSTLAKYGLLESTRDQVRVTPRAVAIIELKPGNPERADAIREAAFAPALYAELHNQFGNRLPSDDNFRMFLIRRGFNPKAVGEVIRAYRDTMAFVGEEGAGLSTDHEDVDDVEDEAPMEATRTQETGSRSQGTPFAPMDDAQDVKTLRFPIGDDLDVYTTFKGNVTAEALDAYIQILRLTLRMPETSSYRQEQPVPARTVRPMLSSSRDDSEEAG